MAYIHDLVAGYDRGLSAGTQKPLHEARAELALVSAPTERGVLLAAIAVALAHECVSTAVPAVAP